MQQEFARQVYRAELDRSLAELSDLLRKTQDWQQDLRDMEEDDRVLDSVKLTAKTIVGVDHMVRGVMQFAKEELCADSRTGDLTAEEGVNMFRLKQSKKHIESQLALLRDPATGELLSAADLGDMITRGELNDVDDSEDDVSVLLIVHFSACLYACFSRERVVEKGSGG